MPQSELTKARGRVFEERAAINYDGQGPLQMASEVSARILAGLTK